MDWLQGPGAVVCGAAASGAVVGFLVGRASAPPSAALEVLGIKEIGNADWPDWVSARSPSPLVIRVRLARFDGSPLRGPCRPHVNETENCAARLREGSAE